MATESTTPKAETAHTPGPWARTEIDFAGGKALSIDGICVVFGHGKTPDANANLIAAAPAILAALKICRDAIEDAHDNHIWDMPDDELSGAHVEAECDYCQAIKAADEAINEAEGKKE